MVEAGGIDVTDIPALKWPEIGKVRFRYLGEISGHKTDILTALFVEDCPAVYADVDGKLGIRYDPETGHVAGVEIRGFEDSFLCQQRPTLPDEWAALKPEAVDGIHSSGWLNGEGALSLTRCLQEAVKEAATGLEWSNRQAQSLAEYRKYLDWLQSRSELEPPSLKWPEIRRVMFWYTGELENLEIDSLLMLFVDNRSATTIDADKDLLIRYDDATGDVIGVEIEDFENCFLKQRPELADSWAALKPSGEGGIHNSLWLTDNAALGYACLLKDLAYQGTLAHGWPYVDKGDILLWSKYGVPV